MIWDWICVHILHVHVFFNQGSNFSSPQTTESELINPAIVFYLAHRSNEYFLAIFSPLYFLSLDLGKKSNFPRVRKATQQKEKLRSRHNKSRGKLARERKRPLESWGREEEKSLGNNGTKEKNNLSSF